jgi:peptidoglycan hydrolase-like protein with peptidoglycan-binding domain
MRGSSALTVLGITGALLLVPGVAQAAPADITGLTGTVGDHAAVLSWTGSGTAGAVVRDVTGVSGTLDPAASGTEVANTGTAARDTHYLNTESRTYAVWAKDSDGTTSPDPATVVVDPIAPAVTTLTLDVDKTVAAYRQNYTLTGSLQRLGVASPNMRVDLLARQHGTAAWKVARRFITDANGAVTTSIASLLSVDLVLRYYGDAFSQPVDSTGRTVQMQPSVTSAFSPNAIVRPETTSFTGHVPPGLPSAVIHVQRRNADGSYTTVKAVTPNSSGNWTYTFAPTAVGSFVYRALLPHQAAYLGAVSAPRVLRVETRDLVIGDKGNDVLALERTLAALHYSPGKVDGTFDQNTKHAVITFQKVERLSRTGKWTKTERTRVARPRGYALRWKYSGHAVEVDITRQIVVYSEGGVIKLIVDASTGGEYHYCYQGECDVAHTPRGFFHVQHKIDGVRTSKLGYLYRPSYFYQGYALHGEAYDVPTYPASHGCVRMTDYNTDLLYSKLVIGMPVHIYDE